jgi:hypothetical protein
MASRISHFIIAAWCWEKCQQSGEAADEIVYKQKQVVYPNKQRVQHDFKTNERQVTLPIKQATAHDGIPEL